MPAADCVYIIWLDFLGLHPQTREQANGCNLVCFCLFLFFYATANEAVAYMFYRCFFLFFVFFRPPKI